MIFGGTDLGRLRTREAPSKQPISVLGRLQGRSQSLDVTAGRRREGDHPASISAPPAAARVKWIPHIGPRYPALVRAANRHPPALPRLHLKPRWRGSLVSLLPVCFFGRLFDYGVFKTSQDTTKVVLQFEHDVASLTL